MATYLKCKIQHNNYHTTAEEDKIVLAFMPEVFRNTSLPNDEWKVKLNGRIYLRNLLFLENEILFNRMRKCWKCIENQILTGSATVHFASMKEIINILLITNHNLQKSRNKETHMNLPKSIDLFKKSIQKIADINDDLLFKLTSNIITIKEEPISQYFHSYLTVFYMVLSIEKLCVADSYQNTYKSVMLDLIKLSEIIYERHKSEILYIQPYPCLCVKNLWIYLMQNKISSNLTFWTIFNMCVENKDEEFSIWLMRHLATVLCSNLKETYVTDVIREEDMNIDLLNRILQSVVTQAHKETRLFNILKLLDPVVTVLWMERMRLDPFQILCDHFYKNINYPMQQITVPKSVSEFQASINCIVNNSEGIKSSYEYFLCLLYKHLRKYPMHWKKLQGRIYSRLPEQKVKEFNDIAIHNIALLFFTLALLEIQEVLEKLNTILGHLPNERQNTELMWILHICMIFTSIQQNKDITKIATKLQVLVQNGCESRQNHYLMKHYLYGLDIIFRASDNFSLNQKCLLGSWLAPFMSACPYSDLCTLIQLLIDILRKAEYTGKWTVFKPTYVEYVLPTLKEVSITSSAPQIGELAGLIALNCPDLSGSLTSYFCNETVNVSVTKEFVSTILSDVQGGASIASNENVLIAAWCRICLLITDTMNAELCKKIFNLEAIRSIVFIEDCGEPFVDFIKALSKQMLVQSQVFRLKELCVMCFASIDRWICSYLTPSTADSQVLYLFTKLSLLFYYCAPLLYQKSKSNCVFNRLVTTLLLPTDILMGKPLSFNILHAIEKTWHLFVKGIYKLDHKSDPYIDRTLKDLIIRYIPHFSTVNSPIINILDNNDITNYTFEKINNTYLLHSARSSEENTFKTLKMIKNVLEIAVELPKIQCIIRKVLPGIFEVIIFNVQKSVATEIVKYITLSEWYSHIRSDIQSSLQCTTSKHLAFSANNYFQFITVLQKYMPEDVRSSLPHIKNEITHVERMRGVGFDNTLRQALSRIENSLDQNERQPF